MESKALRQEGDRLAYEENKAKEVERQKLNEHDCKKHFHGVATVVRGKNHIRVGHCGVCNKRLEKLNGHISLC